MKTKRKPQNPAIDHIRDDVKISQALIKQVVLWRKKAILHVKSIDKEQERQELAHKYYDSDQSSLNNGMVNQPWPEMKRIIKSSAAAQGKQKRDSLITANSICGEVKYYKKAWLPTLQELRDLNEPYWKPNK